MTRFCVFLAVYGLPGTTWPGSILNSCEHTEHFYKVYCPPGLDTDSPNLLKTKLPISGNWSSRPHWMHNPHSRFVPELAIYTDDINHLTPAL